MICSFYPVTPHVIWIFKAQQVTRQETVTATGLCTLGHDPQGEHHQALQSEGNLVAERQHLNVLDDNGTARAGSCARARLHERLFPASGEGSRLRLWTSGRTSPTLRGWSLTFRTDDVNA